MPDKVARSKATLKRHSFNTAGCDHFQLENLAKKYREKLEYVVRLCFDNTYTDLLLTDIYRLQGEVLEQTVFSQSVRRKVSKLPFEVI